MSFGLSPSDVIKLLEVTTRVYLSFKDANEKSESQVESLVREFTTFAELLLELDELMKEYGRPLPFPVEDFKKTLKKCEESLKPYKENLVDKKMGAAKAYWTIKYIGKEKELDGLRKQITGHYQALNMCLMYLQLRLNLEQTKRSQRLLAEPRHRALSLGGRAYTSEAIASSSRPSRLALPETADTHPLYKDWEIFNRWLKSEDERIAVEAGLSRPLSLGDTPPTASSGDPETAALLYHWRRELDDAITIEENRAKRTAMGRTHLAPSDATKKKVRNMPPVPKRTYTLETDHSGLFSGFESSLDMSASAATIRPGPSSPSPGTSPMGSPPAGQSYFLSDLPRSPTSISMSPDLGRNSSVSTNRSSLSTSPGSRLSVSGLGISTAGTTPEQPSSQKVRPRHSVASLATIALGEGALQWVSLCRKVQVERKSREQANGKERVVIETKECDMHWRYREDAGIVLRASYRSSKDNSKVRLWTEQNFPATGPSIPLTTSYGDGDLSIDFPRGSCGKLDKNWLDIKYTFAGIEASKTFQTLLYTNNGKDPAELLWDKPIITISSDKNKPECRGRNIRLWKKSEMHLESGEPIMVDVLVLLFFTSALEDKGHWVEEPHYAFEWLTESVYKKKDSKLSLVFSKDAAHWMPDKLFKRRQSSRGSVSEEGSVNPTQLKGKEPVEIPAFNLMRSSTAASTASSAASIKSSRTIFGRSKDSSKAANLNRFGYSKLDIEFQSIKERKEFLEIWQKYVRPLGGL